MTTQAGGHLPDLNSDEESINDDSFEKIDMDTAKDPEVEGDIDDVMDAVQHGTDMDAMTGEVYEKNEAEEEEQKVEVKAEEEHEEEAAAAVDYVDKSTETVDSDEDDLAGDGKVDGEEEQEGLEDEEDGEDEDDEELDVYDGTQDFENMDRSALGRVGKKNKKKENTKWKKFDEWMTATLICFFFCGACCLRPSKRILGCNSTIVQSQYEQIEALRRAVVEKSKEIEGLRGEMEVKNKNLGKIEQERNLFQEHAIKLTEEKKQFKRENEEFGKVINGLLEQVNGYESDGRAKVKILEEENELLKSSYDQLKEQHEHESRSAEKALAMFKALQEDNAILIVSRLNEGFKQRIAVLHHSNVSNARSPRSNSTYEPQLIKNILAVIGFFFVILLMCIFVLDYNRLPPWDFTTDGTQIRRVKLTKQRAGFGFTLKGAFVSQVIDGGAAQGKLRRGDEILAVNWKNVETIPTKEIAPMIRASETVTLYVRSNLNRLR